MNVQVVCTLEGERAWVSDPVAGARHDVYCLDQSGALDGLVPDAWTGDKGYVYSFSSVSRAGSNHRCCVRRLDNVGGRGGCR